MGEIINKTKGKIKRAVGDLTGDKALVREGERDELKGDVQGAVADAGAAVKKVVKDAKRALAKAAK